MRWTCLAILAVTLGFPAVLAAQKTEGKAPTRPPRLDPPPVSTDKTVRYDYDIVYVRLLRRQKTKVWAQAGVPLQMNAGADLMLLHPDGREEVLVPGGRGSVTDPVVSFDGEWVYYSLFHDLTNYNHGFAPSAADIYKVHVPTRKVVRITDGGFSPNTGAAYWAEDYQKPQPGKTAMPYPVCNMGPCPLPGGRVMFTSNRHGFISPRPTNNGFNVNLQLFVMDDDGSNVEPVGHLNIGAALHPSSCATAGSCSAPWKTRGSGTRCRGACGAFTPTAPTGTRSSARLSARPFTFTRSSRTATSSWGRTTGAWGPRGFAPT